MELGRVVARCSVFSVIFGFLYGSVFGYEHVLDPMFHALGFAEKPLEVQLAPKASTTSLIASVVAGVLIIVSAIVTGIISNLRKHIIAKIHLSVNGVSGLVFYVSLIALSAADAGHGAYLRRAACRILSCASRCRSS